MRGIVGTGRHAARLAGPASLLPTQLVPFRPVAVNAGTGTALVTDEAPAAVEYVTVGVTLTRGAPEEEESPPQDDPTFFDPTSPSVTMNIKLYDDKDLMQVLDSNQTLAASEAADAPALRVLCASEEALETTVSAIAQANWELASRDEPFRLMVSPHLARLPGKWSPLRTIQQRKFRSSLFVRRISADTLPHVDHNTTRYVVSGTESLDRQAEDIEDKLREGGCPTLVVLPETVGYMPVDTPAPSSIHIERVTWAWMQNLTLSCKTVMLARHTILRRGIQAQKQRSASPAPGNNAEEGESQAAVALADVSFVPSIAFVAEAPEVQQVLFEIMTRKVVSMQLMPCDPPAQAASSAKSSVEGEQGAPESGKAGRRSRSRSKSRAPSVAPAQATSASISAPESGTGQAGAPVASYATLKQLLGTADQLLASSQALKTQLEALLALAEAQGSGEVAAQTSHAAGGTEDVRSGEAK